MFFYEAFEEEEAGIKKYISDTVRAGYTWKSVQESAHEQPPAALISVRTQSLIPPGWAADLKGILSRSTGYDHLIRYREKYDDKIGYGYLPLYCHRAVAEQAMMLWMTLFRKFSLQITSFDNFHRDGLTGWECAGKNLLVVGVGNIGYEVTRIGEGLNMEVFGVDIIKKHPDVHYVDISIGMGKADVIVCCMNLTRENKSYFSRGLFENTKESVILVNIARGELTPSEEMLCLIQNNKLGGLALDVFENESELAVSLREGRSSDNNSVQAALELRKYSNVIMTPHNSFNTEESVIRKSQQSVEQVHHFLDKEFFIWNVPGE